MTVQCNPPSTCQVNRDKRYVAATRLCLQCVGDRSKKGGAVQQV